MIRQSLTCSIYVWTLNGTNSINLDFGDKDIRNLTITNGYIYIPKTYNMVSIFNISIYHVQADYTLTTNINSNFSFFSIKHCQIFVQLLFIF